MSPPWSYLTQAAPQSWICTQKISCASQTATRSMLAVLRRKLKERNAELLDERKITFQMRTDISQMISELGDVKSQFLTRLPNMEKVTGKHEVGEPDKPKHCTDKPLDSDPCTYKKGSPLPDKTVQETVVNVIDHLSLSGYVSPLRQTKNNSRARYSKCRPLFGLWKQGCR